MQHFFEVIHQAFQVHSHTILSDLADNDQLNEGSGGTGRALDTYGRDQSQYCCDYQVPSFDIHQYYNLDQWTGVGGEGQSIRCSCCKRHSILVRNLQCL